MVRGAAKLKRESSRRRTIPASVRFIRAFYATAQPPHATLRKLPATPRAMLRVQGSFDYARIPLRGIHPPLRMTVMKELQALSGVKVCGRTRLRTRHDLYCLIATKRHSYRLAAIWILQGSRSVVTGPLRNTQPQGEAGLKFVHPFNNLVILNRFPGIRGPVLVEITRILYKKHLVGINFVFAGPDGSDRH